MAGHRDDALAMMAQAREVAAMLPEQMPALPPTVHRLQATPAQVALYNVSVWWGLGDAGAALAAGQGLRAEQFPTQERRARLHTDLARAHVLRHEPEPAIARLLAAYQHAPGEVRDRTSIRAVAVELVQRHRRTPGARELAALL
ncbi:hypothetical protein [Actinomadura litoris]|uniref:hypothetical protein n=1 Tax=Actinomadura litoris TaxID=2678616 RepID=UPI001FA7B8A7|nr:hypothetical protein [Actinomadura litoris]